MSYAIEFKQSKWANVIQRLSNGSTFYKHGRYGSPKYRWVGLIVRDFASSHKRAVSYSSFATTMSIAERKIAQKAIDSMSKGEFYIEWKDEADKPVLGSISLNDVYAVVAGQTTAVFKRKSGKPNREHLSFSLIGTERTLDLEAANLETKNQWIEDLNDLLEMQACKSINVNEEIVDNRI